MSIDVLAHDLSELPERSGSEPQGGDRYGLEYGSAVLRIFGALAEFERAVIRERTKVGLTSARPGPDDGRRKPLDEEQRRHAVALYRSRGHTVKEICELVGVSTLYA